MDWRLPLHGRLSRLTTPLPVLYDTLCKAVDLPYKLQPEARHLVMLFGRNHFK